MRFVQEEAKNPWLSREESGTEQTDVGESARPQGCGSLCLSDPDPLPTPVPVCFSHKRTAVENPAVLPVARSWTKATIHPLPLCSLKPSVMGARPVIHACVITRPANTDSLPKDGALE